MQPGTLSLPDALGIGVQKGGTTTLHHLLQAHPEVYLPACKEVHFFSKHYAAGPAWYARHFAEAPAHCRRIEITPYYVFHPMVPERVRALLPRVRLILLLRDPVERALSQLFHSRRLGFETLPAEQALARHSDDAQGLGSGGRASGSDHFIQSSRRLGGIGTLGLEAYEVFRRDIAGDVFAGEAGGIESLHLRLVVAHGGL